MLKREQVVGSGSAEIKVSGMRFQGMGKSCVIKNKRKPCGLPLVELVFYYTTSAAGYPSAGCSPA